VSDHGDWCECAEYELRVAEGWRTANLRRAEKAEAQVADLTRRLEGAEKKAGELADALKWERVAFEGRRVRLESAERERDALRARVAELERRKA